jgi:hypothetical protein
MPINTEPVFLGNHFHWVATLTNQVFPRGGGALLPTSPALLGTAGNYGALIEDIIVAPNGQCVQNNIRFYSKMADSSTLVRSIDFQMATIPAGTEDASIGYFIIGSQLSAVNADEYFPVVLVGENTRGIKLHPNESLYVGLGVVEATSSIHVSVYGGDYAATEF